MEEAVERIPIAHDQTGPIRRRGASLNAASGEVKWSSRLFTAKAPAEEWTGQGLSR